MDINSRAMNENVMKSKTISKDRYYFSAYPEQPSLCAICIKKSLFRLKHRCCSRVCTFLVFTCIAMTIGIVTISVTLSKKTNKICQLNFRHTAGYRIGANSRPRHIVVADVDNDNNLDLVVANSGTDNIGVFLGYKNGTFASQITCSTGLGSQPYSVAVGDFNKDNRLDIVVANYGTNNIGLFLGYGNGSFTNQRIFSLNNSRPLSLVVDDINNDNQLDIIVANYGTSNVAVLLGYSNGYFKLEIIFDMGYDSIPYSLMVKDFDNNNRLDIAVVNYGTNNLVILLSDENGSFVNHTYSTGLGSHPCSIAVGDFDADDKIDIAVANSGTDSIGIFFGNGNGIFQDMITHLIGSGSRPQFIAFHDIDNDGSPDIVVANLGNNNVLAFKGHKNRTFFNLMTYSTGENSNPCSIAIGDFDKDNRSDVAVAINNIGNILVLTEYGIYPKASEMTYSTDEDSQPYSVVLADLNHDTYLDIIVANSHTSTVSIFIGLGNGAFKDPVVYNMDNNSQISFVSVDDFNNDQQLDFVVVLHAINKIHILLGNGDGTFRHGETYSTGNNSQPYIAAAGDFNEDGNLDIITSNYGIGNAEIFFGYGNGTFTDVAILLSGLGIYSKCVDVGDLNNDNILDIIATDSRNGLGIITLLGYGNGSFQDPIWSLTDHDPVNCFATVDLNRDHRLDIMYTSSLSISIGILYGYGNGSFGHIIKYSSGSFFQTWSILLAGLMNNNSTDIGTGNIYNFLIDFINPNSTHIGNGDIYDFNTNLLLVLKNKTFAPKIFFDTGFESVSFTLAFGDLNNDNQVDIVLCDAELGNINVFLTHYGPTFANENSYSTGSGPHPYSIVVGDLNNDNQLEIVAADSVSNDIKILLDYNRGFYMKATTYSTGFDSHPQYVTVADFNKDNILDIAVANTWKDNIYVFLGLGNATFNTPTIHSTGSGSNPSSIATGDFNKDGWIDIAVANQKKDNIGIFLGFDYSTFVEDAIFIPGVFPKPTHAAIGDFNNDSYLDIVVVNSGTDEIGVYLGYGNGAFSTGTSFETGSSSNPVFVAVGDFNNDNQSDIVVANYDTHTIGIFVGYGNGSFESQKISGTNQLYYPVSIAIGDFNNDSYLDIVVANRLADKISILLGYGNGSFDNPSSHSLSVGSSPAYVIVDNLNKDFILDIVVANYDGNSISIFLGNGDGTFEDKGSLSTGVDSGPISIATGNLNNDSWIDIAVANQKSKTIGVFFGYGNGKFSSQKTFSTDSQSYLSSILVGKLNNDAFLDIAISDWGAGKANIGILYGFGDGNFTLRNTYRIDFNSRPASIATGDFNNDHRTDLAVCNSNKHSVTIMLRDKSEPFAVQTSFSTGNSSRPQSVTVRDFNNDDKLDIAVANSGTDNIGIFLGYGNGSFAPQDIYPINNNSQPVSIATGDFDNDGKLDIVVANHVANNINIYFGYDNGSFTSLRTYSTGENSAPFAVTVADLNKDNHLDIIVANWGINNVLVFVGIGNGSFSELGPYSMGYNARSQSVAVGDFNNDNLTDIAVANEGADYIEILEQIC